jgi:hypothetical protein
MAYYVFEYFMQILKRNKTLIVNWYGALDSKGFVIFILFRQDICFQQQSSMEI